MTPAPVRLRPTTPDDLDFVLALEHRPDNREYIGQWRREEHLSVMARPGCEHLIVEGDRGAALGYLIAFDAREAGFGTYIKRIAVALTSRGSGRRAIAAFLAHVWADSEAPLVSLAVRRLNLRAQRCYQAVGFEEWPLSDGQRAEMHAKVDALSDDCLVMRIGRPAHAGVAPSHRRAALPAFTTMKGHEEP